jgi:excisionase family DNA binding protein
MSSPVRNHDLDYPVEAEQTSATAGRLSVNEIARSLGIGRLSVYRLLEEGRLPGIRIGRRWLVTRDAFENWLRTCGVRNDAGLHPQPEVKVVN